MKKIQPPPQIDLGELLTQSPDFFGKIREASTASFIQHANDVYLHWDQLRWRPLPGGIPAKLIWTYIRFQRNINLRNVPVPDKDNNLFAYWLPDSMLRILSQIDRWSGTTVETEHPNLPLSERYVISSMMEEAIASSQLEGAITTRKVAKDMLRSGRKPQTYHEQMIYNNWMAIQHLRLNKTAVLTPEYLCEIHSIVTENTLSDPDDSGRIRSTNDVVVQYGDTIVHQPPEASLLNERINRFCEFANNDSDNPWIHPVVKASIIHFWLAYDHPFVDGNGRTARVLFYWYLLSRGYWLFEYLSISRSFLRAPAQYARAYLYTENDNRDLTYFIVYNLRVVHLAFKELHLYLHRKEREIADASKVLQNYRNINSRQRALLSHALRHPDAAYTVQVHKNLYDVAYDTARTDLSELVERNLLVREMSGRAFVFKPIKDLLQQLVSNTNK